MPACARRIGKIRKARLRHDRICRARKLTVFWRHLVMWFVGPTYMMWNSDCPVNTPPMQTTSRQRSPVRPKIGNRSSAFAVLRCPWKRSIPLPCRFCHTQGVQMLWKDRRRNVTTTTIFAATTPTPQISWTRRPSNLRRKHAGTRIHTPRRYYNAVLDAGPCGGTSFHTWLEYLNGYVKQDGLRRTRLP